MPISNPDASHVPGCRHFRLTAASFAHLDNFRRRNIHSPWQARTNCTSVWRQNSVEFFNKLILIHCLVVDGFFGQMFLWSSSIWFVHNCNSSFLKSELQFCGKKQKVGWVLFANDKIRDWPQNGNQSRQFLTNCLKQAMAAPTFHIPLERQCCPAQDSRGLPLSVEKNVPMNSPEKYCSAQFWKDSLQFEMGR